MDPVLKSQMFSVNINTSPKANKLNLSSAVKESVNGGVITYTVCLAVYLIMFNVLRGELNTVNSLCPLPFLSFFCTFILFNISFSLILH